MTGVQIVGIAVISLVVIFLVAEYFMANFMATYILTPSSKLCPTPEQIKERKTCEISAERAVYADADFDAYEEWETERFFVKITEYIYRRYFIHWNTQEDVRFLHMDLDRIVTLWFLMRNCFVSWDFQQYCLMREDSVKVRRRTGHLV